MDADGSNVRRLTTAPGDDAQPDFSPDGRRIVFASKRDGLSALYVMNADGTGEARLSPPCPDAYESPAWSPDGTRLVYVRSRGGVAAIWTMKADGTNETKVMRPDTAYPTPAWQPRDAAPPTVTLRGPVEGATYLLGEAVVVGYACVDESNGSGVEACSGSAANGGRIATDSVGPQSFTVYARDRAGNTTSVVRHYTVVAGPPGSARDRLDDLIAQLDSLRPLFDRPGGMTWTCTCDPYWFGRETLVGAVGGLRWALGDRPVAPGRDAEAQRGRHGGAADPSPGGHVSGVGGQAPRRRVGARAGQARRHHRRRRERPLLRGLDVDGSDRGEAGLRDVAGRAVPARRRP